MRFLVVAILVVYLAILTVGALSGRIRPRGRCCTTADPSKDLRMRQSGARWDDDGGPTPRVDPPRRSV